MNVCKQKWIYNMLQTKHSENFMTTIINSSKTSKYFEHLLIIIIHYNN